jgi:hypothetical protein
MAVPGAIENAKLAPGIWEFSSTMRNFLKVVDVPLTGVYVVAAIAGATLASIMPAEIIPVVTIFLLSIVCLL